MIEDRSDIATQLRLEHEAVLEMVRQVELVVSQSDPSAIGPGWGESAARSLGLLHSRLKSHFAFEEAGGFMEEVLVMLPGAVGQIEKLRADHQRFLAALEKLTASAKAVTPATHSSVAHLCEQIREFLTDLKQHENQENSLVQSAFVDDLGMVD
jgi:iron-sulfur cluster repair protein YtfE (RIC family)